VDSDGSHGDRARISDGDAAVLRSGAGDGGILAWCCLEQREAVCWRHRLNTDAYADSHGNIDGYIYLDAEADAHAEIIAYTEASTDSGASPLGARRQARTLCILAEFFFKPLAAPRAPRAATAEEPC
jgi:hypothetical protein